MHCASTTPSANARCKSSANSINILFFPVYSLISTAQSSLFSFLWFFECVAKKKKNNNNNKKKNRRRAESEWSERVSK